MQRKETAAIEQFQKGRYTGNRFRRCRSHHILALCLTVTDLSCLRGEKLLFRDLSFSVTAGRMLVLMGPNGVGKSSLLRILAGFLRPEAGHIRIDGADDEDGRGAIDYLGHADGLRDALSVAENLIARQAMLGRAGRGMAIDIALDALGVAHLETLPAGVLSAGQRRRVALAGLLGAGRPIWLLDEPTSALDAEGSQRATALFAEHCAAGGIIVAATHLPLSGASEELRLGSPIGAAAA